MKNEVKLEAVCEPVFGMTTRWYRQLVAAGLAPPVRNGNIDFFKAAKAVIDYYKKMAAKGKDSVTLTEQRTRLTAINADRKQLLLEKERGELIRTEEAMLAWGLITKNIDNKLSAIPRKSAPLLYGLTLSEIEAKQIQIINEVRNEVTNPNLNQLKREWEIVRVSATKGKARKQKEVKRHG